MRFARFESDYKGFRPIPGNRLTGKIPLFRFSILDIDEQARRAFSKVFRTAGAVGFLGFVSSRNRFHERMGDGPDRAGFLGADTEMRPQRTPRIPFATRRIQ